LLHGAPYGKLAQATLILRWWYLGAGEMGSDPESQKRYQAWLDKRTYLPPDPYSTDAAERRAFDDLRPINDTPLPPDGGADRGLAILALVGGAAALLAIIFIVGFAYQLVQSYPLSTVVGVAAALVFIYLPRRWKIRTACGVVGLLLVTFAVLAAYSLVQERALANINARGADFISVAEPKFRVIAFHAVERGLRHALVCADCTGEASTEFRPAHRPGALLIVTRTMRYGWPISGHQMNINLQMSATISQDDVKNNAPIEPQRIEYSKPVLVAEFVFPEKRNVYGGAVKFRSFDDLSQLEKSFVNSEIIARNPIAWEKIQKCRTGKPFNTWVGQESVSMIDESDTVSERNPDGQMQQTNYFKCERFQTNRWPDVVNTVRYTLRSYSLIPSL
jgi:hypothetical protein